jgi:hypothetical protein
MQQEFCWPWVQEQVAHSIDIWNRSAAPSLHTSRSYSQREQQQRERAFHKKLATAESQIKKHYRSCAVPTDAWNRLAPVFTCFAETALDLEPEAVRLVNDSFLPAARKFASLAKQFDASLGVAEIVQACRSAWTACGLQIMLGDRMEVSAAILAYSLLYPYSDNYIDRFDVSLQAKRRFSQRFKDRLCGRKPPCLNHREAAIWTLVEIIEGQFPRQHYPQVYDCLLAIHRAQEESMAQLDLSGGCTDIEVHRITAAKGGTSVLTDACLAHGSLNEEESSFAFLWGVLLQLGDDLQDVREDWQNGSATVFTRALASGTPLDAPVAQLLNFSHKVGAEMEMLPNASPVLQNLMKRSWQSLITCAVAESHKLFTPAFLRKVETSSPFRFNFLREHRARLARQQYLWPTLIEYAEAPELAASIPCTAQPFLGPSQQTEIPLGTLPPLTM